MNAAQRFILRVFRLPRHTYKDSEGNTYLGSIDLIAQPEKRRKELMGLLPVAPTGHPPYLFTDQNGVDYFGWEKESLMPPARFAQVQDIILQIDAGMSRKNLKELAGECKKYLGIASRSPKENARNEALQAAGFLLQELLIRPDRIIPEECYFALAAVCCVRADEDPYTIDPAVTLEKIETFRSAGRAGHTFFTVGTFSVLLGRSLTSKEAFLELQTNWTKHQARKEQVFKSLV
jgi:hypothetical protein